MVREKVTVSTRTLQWKCVESRTDSKRIYYGRFILSPLRKGQADTIGIAMRRALLGEIEGTCITRVKSEDVPHEYSTITGIQESVHEIIMNLKEIILRSNLYRTCGASICVRGPGYVTAQDIILPPYVEIVDNTQHIASLTEPINLCIRLEIERNRGYLIKMPHNVQGGSYPIDAVFMPVRNVNHSIHSYGNGNENKRYYFSKYGQMGVKIRKKHFMKPPGIKLIYLFPFYIRKKKIYPSRTINTRRLYPLFLFTINWIKVRKNKKKDSIEIDFYRSIRIVSQGLKLPQKVQYIYIIGPFEKQSRRSFENRRFSPRRCKTDIGHSRKTFRNWFTKKLLNLLD
uniref:DNA-directed RNA polymerase n=1 Tax=Teucrium mascatense TaxID=2172029 RepID=A0A4Y6I590_9LAMI|nr:RNA polymerase alpha subunit [Teucrium mascatense]QDF64477.1 RNA polymerase alpha subunit [Teucrium mascatense]